MNKEFKQVSLTIGIAAFNEENNIKHLLETIAAQKEEGYTIKEIIVVSDGSTDSTVTKARSVVYPKLRVVNGKERLGKSERLNYLLHQTDTDALLILDADTLLESEKTIANLVAVFQSEGDIGFVCGRAIPRPGKTFIENCINTSREAYDDFRVTFKNGNNAYAVEGRINLLSKKLIKSVTVPSDLDAEDTFMYFSCLKMGLKFRFAKNAIVWYLSPSTLQDQIRQNTRFLSRNEKLESIFGDIVKKEYKLPTLVLYRSLLKTFMRKPIHSIIIFSVNAYCRFIAKIKGKTLGAQWIIATSTKKGL